MGLLQTILPLWPFGEAASLESSLPSVLEAADGMSQRTQRRTLAPQHQALFIREEFDLEDLVPLRRDGSGTNDNTLPPPPPLIPELVKKVASQTGLARFNRMEIEDHSIDIEWRPNRRARRYILRVTEEGNLRITLPRYGTKREALKFAESRAEWIIRRVLENRAQAREDWAEGKLVYVGGQQHSLKLSEKKSTQRTRVQITLEGLQNFEAFQRKDEKIQHAVERKLRDLAKEILPERTRELAAQHGVSPTHVRVGNQKTQWGSCTSKGVVALNWRLIQLPAPERDYVILHELMHLKHLNHSPAFWSAVETVCPTYRSDEKALKQWQEKLR